MSEVARNAGIEALKRGDPKAALQHLAQAVQANPQDAQAYGYLGAAFGQLNMNDKAVECLKQASRLAPESAALRFNLGVALEKAGSRAEAVSAYQQSLALDSGYERARQSLARLGQAAGPAPSPAAAPAAKPPVAPPAPATPATPLAGLNDFVLPGAGASPAPQPSAAPPPGGDRTLPAGPPLPPLYGGGPAAPPAAPWAGAPVVPPPSPGVSPLAAAPPPPPPGTMAAIPPPPFAPPGPGCVPPPPSGLTPLGDWNPPQPAEPTVQGEGGLANWQPAPPRPGPAVSQGTEPMIVTAEMHEGELSRSARLGHCYLAGMGMGVWWGLLNALTLFLSSMVLPNTAMFTGMLPVTFTLCAMALAFGVLIYGLIGLMGGSSEDAESTCGNAGMAVGVLTALMGGGMTVGALVWTTGPILGTIWIARQLGRALGNNINEMQSSMFVVASGRGVAVTAVRPR
jgi:hypothetical protein